MNKSLSNNTQGILWIILTCLMVSFMVTVIKLLSKDMHVTQIVMMRNLFGLIFFLPVILKSPIKVFETKKIKLHLYRAVGGLVGMLVWFYTLSLITLPEAVSISFIVPIFTTIAAVIFLKEKATKATWLSLLIGFLGILIIIRPGFNEIKFAYLLTILATLLWAINNILIKCLTKTETPRTITIYTSLLISIFSIPIAIPYFRPLGADDLLYLVALGIISNLTYISLSTAYSKTDISILQPFDFTRLIFTAILAYFVFGEVIDIWMIIGSLIILLSSIYLTPKEKRNKGYMGKFFKRKSLETKMGIDV